MPARMTQPGGPGPRPGHRDTERWVGAPCGRGNLRRAQGSPVAPSPSPQAVPPHPTPSRSCGEAGEEKQGSWRGSSAARGAPCLICFALLVQLPDRHLLREVTSCQGAGHRFGPPAPPGSALSGTRDAPAPPPSGGFVRPPGPRQFQGPPP